MFHNLPNILLTSLHKQPEGIAIEAREVLLKRAAQGTFNFIMNKYSFLIRKNSLDLFPSSS